MLLIMRLKKNLKEKENKAIKFKKRQERKKKKNSKATLK